MKNQAYHEQVIRDVVENMNRQDIDLYLIITSEHADPITAFIPGVDTVGASAYLFHRDGSRYALVSRIDKHDVEISGLFPHLTVYTDYWQELAGLFKSLAPKRAALNFSQAHPQCDGLTLGRYERFLAALDGPAGCEFVSSDAVVIPVLRVAGQ